MIKTRVNDNIIRIILLSIFLFTLYVFILLPIGFLRPLHLGSNDAFLRMLKSPSQTNQQIQNIVIVKIDEETLVEIGKKWPWERTFFAEVLEKISGYEPKVIGMDINFPGQGSNPEEDKILAEAIKKAGNIILASYITEKGDIVTPYTPFFDAAYACGFVNKISDPDYRIRKARLFYEQSSFLKPCFSFEIIITAAYFNIRPDKIIYKNGAILINKDASHPPDSGITIPLNEDDSISINYMPMRLVPNISLKDILHNEGNLQDLLKDKIVLLGTTSKSFHDIYQTIQGLTPGVFINAFTLNTILGRSFIKDAPNSVFLPLVLIFALLTTIFTYYLSLPRGILFLTAEFIVIFIVSKLILLAGWGLDYFSFLFLIVLCYSSTNAYKYGYLLYFSNKLKRMVITDNITGLATGRYFQFKLQLDISKTAEAKSGISVVIFAMPQLLELFKQHKHEQSELVLGQLSIILKQNSRKSADLLAKWKEDKFAAILLKTNIDEAFIYVQKIISKIEENEFLTTEGAVRLNVYAGVSNYPAVKTESAVGLISCAEAASNRAKLTQQKICAFNPQQDKVHVDILKRKSLGSEEDYLTMDIAERDKELLETLNELKNSQQEIQKAHFETILSLVKALEEKDQYTAGHSERVANYAVGIAKQLGIEDPEFTLIRQSALLHDMGKFGLPDSILHKKDALTQDEIGEIKKHPVMGERILEKSKFFEDHIPLIVHHHEKYDGTGYPHGLSGKFIPRGAQIIAIADSIDAMTTGRGYNHVLNIQEAIEELKKSEGKHFDPDYVKPAIDYLLGTSKR